MADITEFPAVPSIVKGLSRYPIINCLVRLVGIGRVVWGSGMPMREFLYVDDAADALIFMMENNVNEDIFNIGTGEEISIRKLAEIIMNIIGFKGEIVFDANKPDGAPRKLVSVERPKHLGWQATTKLEDGIRKAYQDFLKQHAD